MNKLKELKKTIQEANPGEWLKPQEDITLEDVLIAIINISLNVLEAKDEGRKDKRILITNEFAELLALWEWGKPLDDQRTKIINFLHNLLCVKR